MRCATGFPRFLRSAFLLLAFALTAHTLGAQIEGGTYRARAGSIVVACPLIPEPDPPEILPLTPSGCRSLALDGSLDLSFVFRANEVRLTGSALTVRKLGAPARRFPRLSELQLFGLSGTPQNGTVLLERETFDGQSVHLTVQSLNEGGDSADIVLNGNYVGNDQPVVYRFGNVYFDPVQTSVVFLELDDGAHESRFEVEAYWGLPGEEAEPSPPHLAHPTKLSENTGAFWFFSQSNPELSLKVLSACASPPYQVLVFISGMTSLHVAGKVHDRATGLTLSFEHPLGALFMSLADSHTFPCLPSPAASGL